MNPTETEIAAWHAVVRSYHRCETALSTFIAPLGLNLTGHEVLQHLLQSPGLSQQHLAARVFTVKSHLSTIVRDLETRGFISRTVDLNDARAWSLTLTPPGKSLAQKARAKQLELIAAMGLGVSQTQMAQFSKVLQIIEQNLITINEVSH
jgi:MarR family transcriptional regulator, transcriptional regulator for hemolysin